MFILIMQDQAPQSWGSGSLAGDAGDLESKTEGIVLAFDFGQKRIGVAVGNLGLGLAHPLATISSASRIEQFESIWIRTGLGGAARPNAGRLSCGTTPRGSSPATFLFR